MPTAMVRRLCGRPQGVPLPSTVASSSMARISPAMAPYGTFGGEAMATALQMPSGPSWTTAPEQTAKSVPTYFAEPSVYMGRPAKKRTVPGATLQPLTYSWIPKPPANIWAGVAEPAVGEDLVPVLGGLHVGLGLGIAAPMKEVPQVVGLAAAAALALDLPGVLAEPMGGGHDPP